MIIRQLTEYEFEKLQNQLTCKAQQNPLDAAFYMPIQVNNREYSLRLQPSNKRRIAVLQALEVKRDYTEGIYQELITDNKILLALLELLLFQGAA